MTASLMMVTFNRLELTKQTIRHLMETIDYPYNLIIVDNGSSDGTQNYLNTLHSDGLCNNIKIILNEQNKGIAVGRNQCLVAANEFNDPWLVTIDNDVILPQGWLSEAVDILEANPKMAIGVNFEKTQFPIVTKNGKSFQFKKEGNLGTALSVFNRKLFKLIGYFITNNNVFYSHEDADFFFRARMVGYEIGYLTRPGTHLGEGENDIGPYREFKNEQHAKNLNNFYNNCSLYYKGQKSYFIPFKDND